MKRIVHIVGGLGSGGTESMLYKILKYSDRSKYYHEVISLTDEGTIGEKIRNEGFKVHTLNISYKNLIPSLFKAKRICADFDLISTWLYHSDLFGFLVAKILLKKKLLWNVRHSNLDKNSNKARTLKIVKINSWLSKYVDAITYNSEQAFKNHLLFGFKNEKSSILPNGFELDKFKFDKNSRFEIRRELNIDLDEKVIITVGRWNIQKDYHTLFKSLYKLNENKESYKMLMVGANLDESNTELTSLMEKFNLKDRVLLLGRRDDIPALLSAADVYVSSSLGESFSNSIGEAMACELTCVVTDVGESKALVGDTGYVVSAKDYLGMAEALADALKNIKADRNVKARKRILEEYDIKSVVKKYEEKFSY